MNTDIHDELFEATAKFRKQGYSTFCRRTDGGRKEAIRTMPYLLSMRRQIGKSQKGYKTHFTGNMQLNNPLGKQHLGTRDYSNVSRRVKMGLRKTRRKASRKTVGNVKIHNSTYVLFILYFSSFSGRVPALLKRYCIQRCAQLLKVMLSCSWEQVDRYEAGKKKSHVH